MSVLQWGKTSFLTLTHANRNILERGLPDSALPKTHMHAVKIARALGLAYLWIDSLCIIQDSPSDWQYESLTMHDVFRSSTCTIAAKWGSHANAGCVPNLPRVYIGKIGVDGSLTRFMSKLEADVQGQSHATAVCQSKLQQKSRECEIFELTDSGEFGRHQELTKRAWACQELLLR